MRDCQEQDGHCAHWGEGCDGCITIDAFADDYDGDDDYDDDDGDDVVDDGDSLDDPN